MSNNRLPIGIFDSGLGGLTIYKEVRALLPAEDIIYFADTKRAPFGGKSRKTLLSYASQIINFLQKKQVKMIVIGCNTISANCYPQLKQRYTTPMFEPIHFAAYQAGIQAQRGVGVLATEATVKSGVFEKKLALHTRLPIYSRPCPLFVPLIEEGLTHPDIVIPAVKLYADYMLPYIDTLVLGCTHYPFLSKSIQMVAGTDVAIINPAKALAKEVAVYLQRNNLTKNYLSKEEEVGTATFYTTGDTIKFRELCHRLISVYPIVEQAVL
ncbi:MAG: glutamate racemase [Defluviitaleaceae bacterium]|nr:glutamate racemase [Defluviitaleaceae bacterium]